MEISCTDAGYISVPSADMQQFRMDFQTLYSENNMNPRILHFLAPVDIRRFIKTCQQFDNYCDFFPFLAAQIKAFITLDSLAKR